MQQTPSICPLCQHSQVEYYFSDARTYWQCQNCDLVFVGSSEHLNELDEKARYDLHENDSDDLGYRQFLNRLVLPLSKRLTPSSVGLDFGCGPGPTVSIILEELGHQVSCFDKYYANNPSLLTLTYDFITSTEVLEHLREPSVELQKLINMLKPKGYLGIMTNLLPSKKRFADWHYKKDATHICFYADTTFEWVAEQWNLSLEIIEIDVVILRLGN